MRRRRGSRPGARAASPRSREHIDIAIADTRGRRAPDGFPWALLDRVLSVEPGARAAGEKLVSANELYFRGHFPGAPVLPGVLVCEALAQLATYLAADEALRLVAVEKARFRRPVLPGDVLRLEVECLATGPPWRLRGAARAGDAVVAEVEFTAAPPAGPRVHPTAIVARGAELDDGVTVGAFAVVGPHVRIGRETWVGPHAVVEGRTTIGRHNRIFQFASVGAAPQDLKYRGEPSTLTLGEGNIVREYVSLQPGTAAGEMETRIGNGCLFMVGSHVGHDCRVGSQVILANGVALAGHVTVEDFAIVGGLVGVHQFSRVGESALCAAGAMVSMDVPPYCTVAGDRARFHGVNVLGLQRRGFAAETIRVIRRATRLVFGGELPRKQAMARVGRELGHVPEVRRLLDFMTASTRGVCR